MEIHLQLRGYVHLFVCSQHADASTPSPLLPNLAPSLSSFLESMDNELDREDYDHVGKNARSRQRTHPCRQSRPSLVESGGDNIHVVLKAEIL